MVVARNSAYLIGLTPAALLLSLFFVGPALWAAYSSLTNLALVGIDAANPRFIGLDNYARLGQVRRDLARIETILREREIAAAEAGAPATHASAAGSGEQETTDE